MTIVATWIENKNDKSNHQRLVVASDSRLSGGGVWDCCPKIFPLDRDDSVIAFCGNTYFTYPLILQILTTIKSYRKSASREMVLCDLASHITKLINDMLEQVNELPDPDDKQDFKLILAGYSNTLHGFQAWEFFHQYVRDEKGCKIPKKEKYAGEFSVNGIKYQKEKNITCHNRKFEKRSIYFFGDHTDIAEDILIEKLSKQSGLHHKDRKNLNEPLGLLPLQVIAELSTNESIEKNIKTKKEIIKKTIHLREIGGAPQIFKIYTYLRVLPFNILWRYRQNKHESINITHLGRPLLNYESSMYACYDLENFELYTHQKIIEKLSKNQDYQI